MILIDVFTIIYLKSGEQLSTGVPGITERLNKWGALALPFEHIFKIRNGMPYEIEAIGYITKHGIKNGGE